MWRESERAGERQTRNCLRAGLLFLPLFGIKVGGRWRQEREELTKWVRSSIYIVVSVCVCVLFAFVYLFVLLHYFWWGRPWGVWVKRESLAEAAKTKAEKFKNHALQTCWRNICAAAHVLCVCVCARVYRCVGVWGCLTLSCALNLRRWLPLANGSNKDIERFGYKGSTHTHVYEWVCVCAQVAHTHTHIHVKTYIAKRNMLI